MDNNYYLTTDIYLASALIASGLPCLNLIKKESQYTFVFDKSLTNNVTTDELVGLYWAGNLKVSAKELFNGYKELKHRMYRTT